MIIPSIDLMNGKAVQLIGGKRKVIEKDNVFSLLENFNRFGETAVIDLDRAMGKGSNKELIKSMCKKGECRVGGGLRTVDDAIEMIEAGASKIIVGSSAFTEKGVNADFLEALLKAVPREQIIIAADTVDGNITVDGWQKTLELPLAKVLKQLETYCSGFLITTVEREGRMKGIDMALAQKQASTVKGRITIAGGLKDLQELETLSDTGVDVQAGMALYTGELTIEDGFVASLKYNSGLIPMVACDENGQVLMVAYGSKESLMKTFETGNVTYFSRSRNELWMKGETSGNFQRFISVRPDCDRDTLLITVEQTGQACHENRYSCFSDKKFSWGDLENVILDRLENPVEESYTASLTEEKLKEKLDEEAGEFINAYSRENMVWEAADLLYFMTVMLGKSGISVSEVMEELKRRRTA